MTDATQGALLVEAMNAMSYDAMALGATDLDAPLSTLRARFEEAQFPIVSANVSIDGELPNVQPYVLRQIDGHTVAIVGVTSESAGPKLEALGLDPTVEDPIAAVGRVVEEVGEGADIILVLSNLERSSAEALARAVPGVDAIVGLYKGVQRTPAAVPDAGRDVVLHASGMEGQYLGALTLHFDAQGQLAAYDGRAWALTDRYADDPQMADLIRRHAANP
jgi:5'-nucleotidase